MLNMNNSQNSIHKVDVAVIGAGSAGLPAFRAVRRHTDSVVLIEGGVYGTTCARVGCMPSKLLIAAAEAAHSIKTSSKFGVYSSKPIINGHDVMRRVRYERDRFVGFVLESIENIDPKHRRERRVHVLSCCVRSKKLRDGDGKMRPLGRDGNPGWGQSMT